MIKNPYRQVRSYEPVPYKETDQSLCAQEDYGVGLLQKFLNLNGYDAMSQSSFFDAVNIISNSIAQMRWLVKSYDSEIEIPDDFYASHLFDTSLLTQFTTVKNMIKDVLLSGNGFAYIHRDKKGVPRSIEYLPPGKCTIMYNEITRVLMYQAPTISKKLIEPINILHFYMHTNNGITGISILDYARNTIRLSGAADRSATDFFNSGCQVHGILKTDSPKLSKNQRDSIREAWNASQMGSGIGMPVLEGGMSYQPISSNSRDSQLLETRLFNVQEVGRWFSISPILLGDLSKTSYNSIEQSQLAFVLQCLAAYVVMIEQEVNRKIIGITDRKKYYIDISEEDIVKGDRSSTVSTLTTLTNAGVLSRNEARAELGYAPVEGASDLMIPFSDTEQNTIGSSKEKDTENENEEGNRD